MKGVAYALPAIASLLAACNQPFQPNGPPDAKLVVYAVLNVGADTQYVRVATTFGGTSGPDVRGASVQLIGNGITVTFADTTVLWKDTLGNPVPTAAYVAYHVQLRGGAGYVVQVTAPSGLTASSQVTALSAPLFTLLPNKKPGYFVLDTEYRSLSGAAALHFYLDYYVVQNNRWELRTDEVPIAMRQDQQGKPVYTYMSLTPVPLLAGSGTTVMIDSALFEGARVRAYTRYIPSLVVYLDIRFTLTQIDESLYDYYYITNGPVDNSTIRLDVPDYTNVRGGYGVCGTRSAQGLIFSLVP